MKKLKRITLGLALAIGLSACSSASSSDTEKKDILKIGIIQIVDHPSLDAIRTNVIAQLEKDGYKDGDNIQIDYQNAQGDQANLKTIASKLAKESDYIVAIATPSAQAIAAETSEIPTLFSGVTDPVDAGIVKTLKTPDTNFSGTTDAVDIEKQLSILTNINPKTKTVGLIYNAAEANSKIQIDQAKAILKEKGIKTEEATVASTNDIKQAMTSLTSKVDGIYVPSDNTLASGMASVGEVAKEAKIPVIAASSDQTLEGGLATYGIDYSKLGVQTGKMLEKVIKKEVEISKLPVESAKDLELTVNNDMAKALGIETSSIK
ncbi:ABC transporter substrate-binding protein [Mycoplasma sp. P36-A1]|uniref:ABC transporter substrate-binding protein n=1 Tax=Mycoplasma sp. P36-A1 TaxID=3252900 RepID=UPI003C2ED285